MSAAFNVGPLVPELAPLRAIAATILIDAEPKVRRKNPIAARILRTGRFSPGRSWRRMPPLFTVPIPNSLDAYGVAAMTDR
jgi:hypothetical protein